MKEHTLAVNRELRELNEILKERLNHLPDGFRPAKVTSQTMFRGVSLMMPIIVNDNTKEVMAVSFGSFVPLNELPFGIWARRLTETTQGEKIPDYKSLIALES